jgi:DNA-binding response OmpR family regulator
MPKGIWGFVPGIPATEISELRPLPGIDTLREIREIDDKVPVIIVTGYGTQKDEKEALLYGVRDFISKPFNIKEIVSVIDGILEERIEQESGAFKKKTRKV